MRLGDGWAASFHDGMENVADVIQAQHGQTRSLVEGGQAATPIAAASINDAFAPSNPQTEFWESNIRHQTPYFIIVRSDLALISFF